MPEVFTTPGDMRDGCGPYGRHLTGSTDFQKRYSFNNALIGVAGFQLVADRDYAMPIPPPSEDITISSIRVQVETAGTASFVRMGIYDAENMASLALVADAGEAASNIGAAIVEIAFGANIVLKRNGRYLSMICGRGTALCKVYHNPTAGYALPSWLGKHDTFLNAYNSKITYTRANAAFPTIYNGVFSAIDSFGIYMDGKVV